MGSKETESKLQRELVKTSREVDEDKAKVAEESKKMGEVIAKLAKDIAKLTEESKKLGEVTANLANRRSKLVEYQMQLEKLKNSNPYLSSLTEKAIAGQDEAALNQQRSLLNILNKRLS